MVTTDASALHVVRQVGRGPRLVVVHGAMDRSVSFGRMMRHLGGRDVVRYDRRGYARSSDAGPGGLDDHVSDLIAIIGEEPAVVLGHSIGGVIAMAAAARSSSTIGVIAYEPPTPWETWWPGRAQGGSESEADPVDPAEAAEAFMRKMIGDHMWSRLPAAIRAARRSEGDALRADIDSLSTDSAPLDTADLQIPVLFVAGTESTRYHRRAVEDLAVRLPRADLVMIEGAAHGAHLSHPEVLAEITDRFMTRLG